MSVVTAPRDGEVVGRMFEGRAVRHHSETGTRYLCLAFPCEGVTDWFYIPAHSNLCIACMEQREAERR